MPRYILPIFTVLALAACGGVEEKLTKDEQAEIVEDAKNLEAQGSFLMAYREYSFVTNTPGPISEFKKTAGDKSFQMSHLIGAACEPVDGAIKQYFKDKGSYPGSLESFRSLVPKESLVAFNEFKLAYHLDGSVGINCGYYGPINFEFKQGHLTTRSRGDGLQPRP